MVCKENVVSWFGSLSSYKRIDVMCSLLNMCLPMEVRFLGTYIEDVGKRDYNIMKDAEHRANNVSDVTELNNPNMNDYRIRRRLNLFMALLHSCNFNCAVILHKCLANLDMQEVSNMIKATTPSSDENPLEELLLLYTMALTHPAFNYEQRSTFEIIYQKLLEEEAHQNILKAESFKPPQNCIPCANQNDRADPEISTNCVIAPPPMQPFQGEVPIRPNPVISGIPPGMSVPAGICIPGPEQMAMQGSGQQQYVHFGYTPMNHMQPWQGQLVMSPNQVIYTPTEALPYPTSPLVSRQSSPSQSRSHSRSNSPTGIPLQRKSSTNGNSNGPQLSQQQQQQLPPRSSNQNTQTTSNALTTSTSSNQTTNSTALGTSVSLPPLSSMGSSRSIPGQPQQNQTLPPLLPGARLVPMNPAAPYNAWHNNNNDPSTTTTPTIKQQPPPPRLKLLLSGDSLCETGNKEMPNFKGGFQNSSNNEIRRLSDEDISKTDITTNAINSMKSQVVNSITQTPEKKLDGPNYMHLTNEPVENEIIPMENIPAENTTIKPATIQDQAMMNYHHQNQTAMANMRRYPPQMDPSHIQMFAPPTMYPTQNACYGCVTVPVASVQNRYAGCNAPPFYCLATPLQALRLDAESSRHSHSSSSDSTGSRSPPETPPAAPWLGENNNVDHVPTSLPGGERTQRIRNRTQMVRHKSSSAPSMVNGGGPQQQQPPTSLQPCMYPTAGPPGHIAYVPTQYQALRPTTGIYSNYTYARPAPTANYPTIAYQPNGEIMYQYAGHHAHPPPQPGNTSTAATGTPPPQPTSTITVQSPIQQQQPPQQSYVPAPAAATPVVSYAPITPQAPAPSVTQALNPPKISCYNCGSMSHTANDCKEQTMEDITRQASYRLDYTTTVVNNHGTKPSVVDPNQISNK